MKDEFPKFHSGDVPNFNSFSFIAQAPGGLTVDLLIHTHVCESKIERKISGITLNHSKFKYIKNV